MAMQILKLSDGVYLDGNKIEGIKAINIDSSVGSYSEVTLKIVCQVEGIDNIVKTNESIDAYSISTGTLPADTIKSDGQVDWKVMKERMLERTELIKRNRVRKSQIYIGREGETDESRVSEVTIPLTIDGKKIDEIITRTLKQQLQLLRNPKIYL